MEEISSLYYLRFMVDRPGVCSAEGLALRISIVDARQGRREERTVPVVIKTHMAKRRDVQKAMREIVVRLLSLSRHVDPRGREGW